MSTQWEGVVVLGPLGEGESLAPWERDAVVRRSARAPRLPLTGGERDRIAQLVQHLPSPLRQLAVDGAPSGT